MGGRLSVSLGDVHLQMASWRERSVRSTAEKVHGVAVAAIRTRHKVSQSVAVEVRQLRTEFRRASPFGDPAVRYFLIEPVRPSEDEPRVVADAREDLQPSGIRGAK